MADGGLRSGLTWAEMARVAEFLQARLTGGRVQKIRQPGADTIVLECRGAGESLWVRLSAHPRFFRVVPHGDKPGEPSEASAFCMLLRKRIANGRLEEIALDPHDRLFSFSIHAVDEEGFGDVWTLIAELFGPQSNLLFLDPEGRVIAALFDNRLAARGLALGQPYAPPARSGRPNRDDRGLPVEAMADAFAAAEAAYDHETRRQRLLGAVQREARRLEKFVRKLSRERDELPDAEQLTLHGELLLAHLREVRKGQPAAEFPSWEDPARLVRVELDPALTPQQNADRLFKSARRTRRKREDLDRRRRENEDRLLDLEEPEQRLLRSVPGDDLSGLEAELRRLKVVVEKKRQAPPRVREQAPSGSRPFVAADGARIYVGRNAAENEALTFQLARGNDYWLHTDGSPGSHVIVRLPASGELSAETLLDAATLALLHSDLKNAGAGSVLYTRRKFVKKPRDSRTGQVYAAATKTIYVRRDEERVKRLYESREDG